MSRTITDVIAQMRAVTPTDQSDLLGQLTKIEESVPYTAPEAHGHLWDRLSRAVNLYATPVNDDWQVSVVALLVDRSEAAVRAQLTEQEAP